MTTQMSAFDGQDPRSRSRPGGSGPSERQPLLFAVDDDDSTLELIGEIAREAGWRFHGFERLSDLGRALDRTTPSLLILDDDLPDGRGGDLARELRDDPRMDGVPLLVCTAAHPMRLAQITNWAPVISKPFDLSQVEHFLAQAAGRDGGRSAFERAG